MTDRDWQFAIGDLGDPLADIKDWMTPPYPKWVPEWRKRGELEPDREEQDGYTQGG